MDGSHDPKHNRPCDTQQTPCVGWVSEMRVCVQRKRKRKKKKKGGEKRSCCWGVSTLFWIWRPRAQYQPLQSISQQHNIGQPVVWLLFSGGMGPKKWCVVASGGVGESRGGGVSVMDALLAVAWDARV